MPIKKFYELAKDWLKAGQSVQAPTDERARFLLTYNDLLVGTLTAEKGKWLFEYSEEFKKNEELRPIVEFADVNKVYVNQELWQFFASRIPSFEQSEIEAIIKRENIDDNDVVSLLKRFGRRTINNPFELKAA
jgi:HipA-like protein